MSSRDAAERLIAAGLSVIPIKPDGTKSPLIAWAEFQERIMSLDEVHLYFKGICGIAIIAGVVSGNLEIIDIEAGAPQSELAKMIEEALPGLLATLPQVVTPSGGRHIYYRCDVIGRNQKLAVDAKGKVLIETRGEGGYVLTFTSPPQCHPLNKPYELKVGWLTNIPKITPEQRDVLLACCRQFNLLVRDEQRVTRSVASANGRLRPGDDYNENGNALELLLDHGWTITSKSNGHCYLKRPGKTGPGNSATFGVVGPNIFYVFSTNAAPFENDRSYDPFGVWTMLEANGDFDLAAKQLAELGYGDPAPKPQITPPPTDADRPQPDAYTPNEIPTKVPVELAYATATLVQEIIARIFEVEHMDEFRYCLSWHKWMHWKGTYWRIEDTDLAFDQIRHVVAARNREAKATPASAPFARGVETFCRASRVFATVSSQWDAETSVLNTPKGTQELITGVWRPHKKEDYITKTTVVSPESGNHPVFDRFMRDITLGDQALIDYHQRSLGACLSGAITDNFLLFWYGLGQNGKNTLGDLIGWMLGDYAKVVPAETLMAPRGGAQHPTDLANLRGIRLAVSSEVDEGSYFNEQRIKSLTGDAVISARFMRQDFFEFKRTHRHLVYGNHRPMLRIVDPALKARIHIVPFKASFPPESRDPDMGKKLRAEAPQILKWLIDGHQLWLENGHLSKCSAVQEETDAYFEALSTHDLWVSECCLEREDYRGSSKELYLSFKRWKEARGEGVMSQTRWAEWMGSRYKKARQSSGYIYLGITVKDSSDSG
jgi:putative DNA primase/helicase